MGTWKSGAKALDMSPTPVARVHLPFDIAAAVRWPQPGDRMRFLAKNGYDFELAKALEVFEPDAIVTVKACSVSSWSHSVEFEELPGKRWNGVMFEPIPAPPATETGVGS